MADDRYKGETLGKKIARAWFWICVREYLGTRFYTGNHLVLASREGGDVAVLKAMGVQSKRIFAMELSVAAATEFASKHPDVNLRIGDVSQLVNHKSIRGTIVCAHLDFCCWYTPSVSDTVVRVGRFGLADQGILAVGVMKGREFGLVGDELKWLREVGGELFGNDPSATGQRGRKEERAWDARVKSSRLRSCFIGWNLARSLEAPGPVASARDMFDIGYDSGRTPMLYSAHAVHRGLSQHALFRQLGEILKDASDKMLDAARAMATYEVDGGERNPMAKYRDFSEFIRAHPFAEIHGHRQQLATAEFGEADPLMAMAMACVCESFDLPAAGMLNVRPARLAAWRAHRTMGTYAPVKPRVVADGYPQAST